MSFLKINICCLVVVIIPLLPGCRIGPKYVRPEIVVDSNWNLPGDSTINQTRPDLKAWWKLLDDDVLNSLIDRAARKNLGLREAHARIMAARASKRIAVGQRFPDIDMSSDVTRQRTSAASGVEATVDSYTPGATASWEIDFWGKISKTIESASADVEASIESYNNVLIVLYADISRNYINVRTLQDRIRYTLSNIESQRRSVELTKAKRQVELIPELDVQQAELNLGQTEASIPSLQIQLNEAIHRLGILLGEFPTTLRKELLSSMKNIQLPDTLAIGIPMDLLRQRPDIRLAERELAAQTGRIGIARADLYPSFLLSGTLGFSSTVGSLSETFDSTNRVWSIGVPVTWNLFDGGRVRGTVELERARTERLLATYQRTVLEGYEEVENALVRYHEWNKRRQSLERAANAALKAVQFVTQLYDEGLVDFQNVLDAQRTLFRLQDDLAQSKGDIAFSFVQLYRSLGGGWEPATDTPDN